MIGYRTVVVAGLAATAFLIGPALAQAAEGVVVENTALFAGPDSQFPPVDQVPAGTSVQVNGCLTGYVWCDVSFQNDRGWISGQALEILYQSRRVRIVEVAPDVAIVPFVGFEFNSYWDEHYRDRPFYRERDRYASININVNVTGGKGGPAPKGGKETGKVSGAGGEGVQATGGGKPPSGNVGGKGKVVTKHTNGCEPHCQGQGKTGVTGETGKKATTPPVVKKTCKAGEKGCGKGQGNGGSG